MQHLPRVTIWVSGYCSAQWPVSTFPLIAMTGAIRWSPAITFGEGFSQAQLILEEYLRRRPQNNERILDKLVEVLERPDLVVAVTRLQQRMRK